MLPLGKTGQTVKASLLSLLTACEFTITKKQQKKDSLKCCFNTIIIQKFYNSLIVSQNLKGYTFGKIWFSKCVVY